MFFPSFVDQESTVNELRKRWPESLERLTNEAQQIETGRFDLLGFKDLTFGTPPDWLLEPRSGKRSPLMHWSLLKELESHESGDKKIIWELNRHQFFITLGRAYWVSGDERYARLFVDYVSSWMDKNPPGLGLNWLSSLEVSFRAISWLWHAFLQAVTQPHSRSLLNAEIPFCSCRHIETYLSTTQSQYPFDGEHLVCSLGFTVAGGS